MMGNLKQSCASYTASPCTVAQETGRRDCSTSIVTFAHKTESRVHRSQPRLRHRWSIVARANSIRFDAVRICVAFFTTRDELDVLIDAVRCIAKK